jgi:3-oxoacyl-[acyl-carrier protein] reductase
MSENLAGKTALVTGASRGIGRQIALTFGRQGIHVVVNYHEKRSEAEEVCREIVDVGSRAIALQGDVSCANQVADLVEQARRRLGPILILVNNAGISRPQPIEAIGEQDWDEVIDANLKSHFLVTQAVLPDMRSHRWGRIINLSSVAAQLGGVIGPHYAASKAGILGLTHSYACLLAREGITVNAIAPALIHTDMIASNPKAKPELIPIGRFGTVEETADVALMLAGNAYITGQTINVNGGWYMT